MLDLFLDFRCVYHVCAYNTIMPLTSRVKGFAEKLQKKEQTNIENGNTKRPDQNDANTNDEKAFHAETKVLWYMAQSAKYR